MSRFFNFKKKGKKEKDDPSKVGTQPIPATQSAPVNAEDESSREEVEDVKVETITLKYLLSLVESYLKTVHVDPTPTTTATTDSITVGSNFATNSLPKEKKKRSLTRRATIAAAAPPVLTSTSSGSGKSFFSLGSSKNKIQVIHQASFQADLLKACCDASNSSSLRQCALWLLNFGNEEKVNQLFVSQTTSEAPIIQNFIKLNIIQGDSATSQLSSRLLKRASASSPALRKIISTICDEVLSSVSSLDQCRSSSSLEEVVGLIKHCTEESTFKSPSGVVELLYSLGQKLYNNRSPYYCMLRSRYGIDGTPLEAQLFEPPQSCLGDDITTFRAKSLPAADTVLLPFIFFSVIKDSKITSHFTNSGTGVHTMRISQLTMTKNSVLLDCGQLSLLTMVELRVSLPYSIQHCVTVECAIDPASPIKLKQQTEKNTATKFLIILPAPQLCRFLKVNIDIFPEVASSPPPGFCEIALTPRGIHNILSTKSDQHSSALQSKLSSIQTDLSDKRNELSSTLESAKVESDQGSQNVIQAQFKECVEAQTYNHFASQLYTSLCHFTSSQLSTEASLASPPIDISKPSEDNKLDRWLTFARTLITLIDTPAQDDKPNENKKVTVLSWKHAKRLFKYYCVFGPADLRQLVGNWISSQTDNLPDDWVPQILRSYFSTKAMKPGPLNMFPHKDLFELLLQMIKEDLYITVSSQLFSILEESGAATSSEKNNENNSQKIDMSLVSWTLLLLSKIVSFGSKSKTIHPSSRCSNCGMSPIAGVRYRCSNCVNVDLCERCERKSSEIHNPYHLFLKIAKPLPLPPVTEQVVDKPDGPLLPVLYPDAPSEEFTKKKKKKSSKKLVKTEPETFSHKVQCAGCGKNPFTGFRFKCCNCMDYDLCEACEPVVQHFNTHVFLKILRPLPEKEVQTTQNVEPTEGENATNVEPSKSQLPSALIPNQTLIPLVLHRSLYPQKQSSNASGPAKPLTASDELKHPSLKEVMSKRNKNKTPGGLSQSLGSVSVDDDLDDEEEIEKGAKSPLAVIFGFLCDAAAPSNTSIESLLLGIHIAKKIAKQFSFAEVRDDLLRHPRFSPLLTDMMNIGSPFVQSSFLELLEALLDVTTYEDSEIYRKETLAADIRKAQHALREHVSALLGKQQDTRHIEFLLELLSILTPKISTDQTPATKPAVASSAVVLPDNKEAWKSASAPIIVAQEDEDEAFPLDTRTATVLLKFLNSQPLSENSVGYWWNILTLLKGADDLFLIKSPQLMKAVETALNSSEELQTVLHDSVKELLIWLCSRPNAAEFRGELLSKFAQHLQLLLKDDRQTLSLANVIANVLSGLTEKNLPIPVNSEQLVRILESLASSLKDIHIHQNVPDSRSILVGHLLKFINALMQEPSILEQVTRLVCAEGSQTALLLVEWSTSPENSSSKTKSKVDFQQPILAMIHSMCQTDADCKYFIAQCTTLIKRRVTPELVQLTLALLRNAPLVEYFTIELKGYDILIQQMLSTQTKIVTPAIPELYAVIVNQLATGTVNTPQKKVKPGQLEDFHQQCEIIPADGVLANTFKDIAANNSYVWTKKAASKNQEQTFTVKVPYNVVLKEVIVTVYNNWYVENDPSQIPLSLTLYAARAQNSVRPCGKFLFKDPSQVSGSINTYKFTVTNKVVAKFITFKLKHNGIAPLAITRFQLRGHTMTNFVAAESFNISEDIPALLAHCISFPETQAKLAKMFAEDETKITKALKLLDFLTSDAGAAFEDILYYLSQSSLQISSMMLKYLLKEEMSVLQAQLVGRLCNVMDQDRINKLTALKTFVFQQLKRSFSVTLVPLMSALCSVIRQQDSKEKIITLSEEEVMQLYQSAVNSLEGTHMEESFLKFLSAAIQSNPGHFVSIIKKAVEATSKSSNNNNKSPTGRELKIVAGLSSASKDCGSQLLESGIPESVLQNLLGSLKSSTASTTVSESLTFFSDIGYNPLLRDWLGQALVPALLDNWPTLSDKHPSAIPLFIKALRNAANRNGKTQEMIGNFLVDLVKKSKLQQGAFDLLEGMLSLQDTASVCLHHVGAKSALSDSIQPTANAGNKKGSRHLVFNADKAGPASVDGASVVVNANPSYQYVTIPATEGFKSGTLYFEVEIGQNGGSMFVGLCDEATLNNNYLGQYNTASESYGLMGSYSPWFYASKLTSGGKQWGSQFVKGDLVGVTVDFSAGTISFSKNGESMGEAYNGTLGENLLYPAVTLYSVNDQATFIKCVVNKGTALPSASSKTPATTDSITNYLVPIDCPLRYHRSEPVFALEVSAPIQDFSNAVLDRVADADPNSPFKPALKLLFKGKAVSSNLPSIVGLLKNVDSDIIDLEYDVYRVKESEEVPASEFAEFAQNLGNSRITEILVQTNSFASLVDGLFEKTKGVLKKFDEQTAVWMRWLDLLRSQLLIPGYAEKFLQNKDCRNYLFNAMRGDFSLPSKAGQKLTMEEQGVEFFQPLLQSFTQTFAVQAAEDQMKAIRQQALESTLIERVLVGISDLCGIEHRKKDKFEKVAFLKELREKEKKEKQKQAEKNKASGKNYWAKGTGYGTSSDAQTNWDHVAYMKSAHAKAKQQAQLLDVLNAYLDVPNDEALPKQVFEILEASCLVPTLMSYLRNDSLLDIMNQMELHESVFQITRTLTKHHSLIPLLGQLDEETSSIESLMVKLSTMSAIFVKTTEKAAKADKGTKDSKEMQLARNIIQIATDVKQALIDYKSGKSKKSKNAPKEENNTNNNNKEEPKEIKLPKTIKANKDLTVVYKDSLAPHQFAERSMCNESAAYVHHYNTRIESETTGMTNKLKRLVQEISSLANNLPLLPESSVFLRVDEERPDVMQALITGPPGTPYSNGCFQFDIYCPNDYPRVPPCVNLETTGHGSVRFNPNLYNCGKVCLSLLGTWSGAQNEQWNEKTSTILQVLVSIQSLILVERPYFNEPGYESSMGTSHGEQASKEYSANIQMQCLKWAIVEQLKNPSPGFEDVIKIHFKLKKDLVVSDVKEWIKNQPSYNQKSMEELLQTFIAEVDKIDLSAM